MNRWAAPDNYVPDLRPPVNNSFILLQVGSIAENPASYILSKHMRNSKTTLPGHGVLSAQHPIQFNSMNIDLRGGEVDMHGFQGCTSTVVILIYFSR